MKKNWIWILVAIVVIGGVIWLIKAPSKTGKYDQLASCIKSSGAVFYGAFWCPHCQNQKAEFGSSAKLLPYVECSTQNGRTQTKQCTDAGVESYPTWVFPNGQKEIGELSLGKLSELTNCPLPQ